jgi:hypothetical protein
MLEAPTWDDCLWMEGVSGEGLCERRKIFDSLIWIFRNRENSERKQQMSVVKTELCVLSLILSNSNI